MGDGAGKAFLRVDIDPAGDRIHATREAFRRRAHLITTATLVGAVMSVGVTWWRRRHPSVWGAAIAYGPALWIGPWIGLLTTRA